MRSNKESCWTCYKLYSLTLETSEFKQGERGFCSKPCYNKWLEQEKEKAKRLDTLRQMKEKKE